VPYEVLPANSNPVRMNERQWEALDLILKAWTTHDGPFSHEGRFFHYRAVNIWPRPYQQPHPPIWISTTSPSGAARVGARGYVQATFLTGFDGTRAVFDAYRRGWREAGRGSDVPVHRLAFTPRQTRRMHERGRQSCCGTSRRIRSRRISLTRPDTCLSVRRLR
jgi:alkanesulfonate monooxygenase SsuD/methylene tetrahydromethanopterin reductase-like flavin-dependent oxidoreductase (luciferase family)